MPTRTLIYRQCGWMPCAACKDSHRLSKVRRGMMYLLKNEKTGIDEWIPCPVCQGKAEVPQYKLFDPLTGQEIDYENQNRPKELILT